MSELLHSWGMRRVVSMSRRRTPLMVALLLCGALCLSGIGCQPEVAPVSDSELHLWDSGPITLDPAISGEMSSHSYVMNLYSGLVKLNSELETEPDIAESWTVSEDGTTYTFNLRKDVRFHSGRSLTAADFKFSWERACNPATGSRTAATYLNDITGSREVLEGRATEISGVTVVDDYTLQVDIDSPKSYFIDKLTYSTAFVVDAESVSRGSDWWREPNGTGPFKMWEWREGDLIALIRNPDYYGEPSQVDAVYFHLLAGIPSALYEQGEIDVVSVSSAYMDQVTDPANPVHTELVSAPELSLYYIGFDVTEPPFDDVYVRQAFCHAVDRERIVRVLFKDSVQVATGFLPAGLPGYDPALTAFEFDPALARELLEKSSYGSAEQLPPITITVSGYANQFPQYIAAAMFDWEENLGVEVSVRQLEPEVFLYHLSDERDELFSMGWIADYPDPYNFLGTLFGTGEENNIGDYSNPELDELLALAAAELDDEVRLEIYRQAERVVIEDAPCLPLVYGANHVLVKPYVSGYVPSPLGVPDLSVVRVERPTE
ncbi:MAG: peptide ABC transporter substrate-binding protein [Dehalococcoidia bacterium]|nr:peptide ABC transporter substrate-binding protein [Dehalococcoidia bacterium]